MDVAGRGETLEVLLGALGPACCHLRAARPCGQLDGEDELARGLADKVDDGHVGGDLLLLGDQIDTEACFTQSLLDCDQAEVVGNGAGISTQAGTELVEIILRRGFDDGGPGFPVRQLRNAGPVDDAALLAVESLVALLRAKAALLGLWIRAVRAVVADLSAAIALAGHTAALGLVRAVAGEMAGL